MMFINPDGVKAYRKRKQELEEGERYRGSVESKTEGSKEIKSVTSAHVDAQGRVTLNNGKKVSIAKLMENVQKKKSTTWRRKNR